MAHKSNFCIVSLLLNNSESKICPRYKDSSALKIKMAAPEHQRNWKCLPLSHPANDSKTETENTAL